MSFPIVPVEYSALKQACRSGLAPEGRRYWWPYLPEISKLDPPLQSHDIDALRGVGQRLGALVDLVVHDCPPSERVQFIMDGLSKALNKKDALSQFLYQPLVEVVCSKIPDTELCYLIAYDMVTTESK